MTTHVFRPPFGQAFRAKGFEGRCKQMNESSRDLYTDEHDDPSLF